MAGFPCPTRPCATKVRFPFPRLHHGWKKGGAQPAPAPAKGRHGVDHHAHAGHAAEVVRRRPSHAARWTTRRISATALSRRARSGAQQRRGAVERPRFEGQGAGRRPAGSHADRCCSGSPLRRRRRIVDRDDFRGWGLAGREGERRCRSRLQDLSPSVSPAKSMNGGRASGPAAMSCCSRSSWTLKVEVIAASSPVWGRRPAAGRCGQRPGSRSPGRCRTGAGLSGPRDTRLPDSASSSRPTPAKPANSGRLSMPFSTVSLVMRSERRCGSGARTAPETGSSGGTLRLPSASASRRTDALVSSRPAAASVSVVEIVALNSGASTAPTWTSAVSPLVLDLVKAGLGRLDLGACRARGRPSSSVDGAASCRRAVSSSPGPARP